MPPKAPTGKHHVHVTCQTFWRAIAHYTVMQTATSRQKKVSTISQSMTTTTLSECRSSCLANLDCVAVEQRTSETTQQQQRNQTKRADCFLITVAPSPVSAIHSWSRDHFNTSVHRRYRLRKRSNCVHYALSRNCRQHSVQLASAHLRADSRQTTKNVRSVRLLCWIMTSAANHMSRAIHVQATWATRCDVTLFVTDANDVNSGLGLDHVIVVNTTSGRQHLPAKTMTTFDIIYQQYIDKADWFVKADDDTYIIAENMRYFLSQHDTDQPVYFGHHFFSQIKQGYNAGGASYVLSKKALKLFGRRSRDLCTEQSTEEDVELGRCLELLGVKVGDTGDSTGRSRFHWNRPEVMISGEYSPWYRRWDKYGARHGVDSISEFPVSFHYVTPQAMYDLEFYVYRLHVYDEDATALQSVYATSLPVNNSVTQYELTGGGD